jgi:hypothetical protein
MSHRLAFAAPLSVARRVLSVCAAAQALLFAALAFALAPPFLERWVLADHELGGAGRVLGAWCLCAACALLGLQSARLARQLWTRAGRVPARPLLRALLVLGCASTLALACAEVYLRRTRTLDQILSGDPYWIQRWYASRVPGGAELAIDGAPRLHRHDPELGWVPLADYSSEGVSTNSRGLRGKTEHAVPKPPGTRRIVVIGDSFTWGLGVRDEETWPAVLGTLLPDAQVINLAVTGYGTDQQFLRLQQEGFRYEPDLVIVGFFGPDCVRNVRSFRSYAKPRFELVGEELRLVNVPVPAPDEVAARWARPEPFSYAWTLLGTKLRQTIDLTTLAPKWPVTRAILDATLAATREHGAHFLLAYFPPEPAAFAALPDDSEILAQRWAAARGAALVSLRAAFLELAPAARADVFQNHWTPFGNALVARVIARTIAERHWIGSEGR